MKEVDSSKDSYHVMFWMPFPNNLHAHNRGNWRDKQKATKDNRAIAKIIALNDLAMGGSKILGEHEIGYRFYVPENRRRDAANMVQQCKPFVDGLVDAGLIEGDHWQISKIWFVEVQISKETPGVEIHIRKISPGIATGKR
jgi:Holliday junction resolvase RusA-like endonuclease